MSRTGIEKAFENQGAQIAAMARAIAILASSLHGTGLINARSYAQSLRLDAMEQQYEQTAEMLLALADLTVSSVERLETEGHAGLTPISDPESG